MAAIVGHARRTTRDTGEGTHSKRAGAGHRADYQSPGDPGARRDAIDSASGTRSDRDSEVAVSNVGNAGNDPQSSTPARRAQRKSPREVPWLLSRESSGIDQSR